MILTADVVYKDSLTGEPVMTYTVFEEKQYRHDGGVVHEFPNNCVPIAWTPLEEEADRKAKCSSIPREV